MSLANYTHEVAAARQLQQVGLNQQISQDSNPLRLMARANDGLNVEALAGALSKDNPHFRELILFSRQK